MACYSSACTQFGPKTMTKPNIETPEPSAMTLIAQAIEKVNAESGYGSIEVTIHDGRVTQIERREKLRVTEAIQKVK